MLEIFVEALGTLIQPSHLVFLCLGVILGLIVGVLPGLGGIAGLSVVLPFVFGMDPTDALSMMIGLLATTTTSDTFPSVLMGIPGTSRRQPSWTGSRSPRREKVPAPSVRPSPPP